MRDVTSLPHTQLAFGQPWNGAQGNYSPESARLPVDTIILHTSVGSLAGTAAWFNNPASKVSANYGIEEDDIYSFVPEKYVSYHCGNWNTNQRSIGIEHIDNGNPTASRSNALYETSARLVADICKFYNIPIDRDHIKKHNQIVATNCPGNLDVDRIVARANEIANETQEELHSYQLKPSDFINIVTASTNYDDLWRELHLDPSLKKNPKSYTLVLDYINAKVSEARNFSGNQQSQASNIPNVTTGLPDQSKPLMQKDISEIVSEFLIFLKLKKKPI